LVETSINEFDHSHYTGLVHILKAALYKISQYAMIMQYNQLRQLNTCIVKCFVK